MAKTDIELLSFLPQRSFWSLHCLRDLRHWCPCLGMLLQQLDVSWGIWFAC